MSLPLGTSAAHPGQGGDGHINCQPKKYWCDLFAFLGWEQDTETSKDFVEHIQKRPYMGWLKMNGMVFRKVKTSFGNRNFSTIDHEERPQAQSVATFLTNKIK